MQGRGLFRACGSCKAICLNNISAHQSNKNSTDDNPETMEILPNPTTEYDAHKAEGFIWRAKETLNQIKWKLQK